ncbi:RNA-binding cell elongation regulator Jag/EloR [Streptococcus sp. CSL10205-OR2]|uniref:RNA-binding cell elongation regulator Jag/EloR n=1 Tax=Streptococcus sp. CSL10205-OR2 TaxID=2980558 RepID=UPI0021D96D42|nr:RNA-binding cell elongation regulator Jag/EloR [Streptococcus sp. CSL10205-OR2]MCU9533394.1 protein jag [Streptococcus sp. CSL10205-OR2]
MVLFTGKTVEEAIENGLKELNISRLKAHIKVVSREKKGFLGFGRKPAQVEIESISEAIINKADRKAVRGVPDEINSQNAPVKSSLEDTVELGKVTSIIRELEEKGELIDDSVKEQLLESKKSPQTILQETGHINVLEVLGAEKNQENAKKETEMVSIEEASEDVSNYISKIIYEMDLEATIDITHTHRQINLKIDTPDPGRVIGYHGKVLKSLQLLAQNYLHDHYSKTFSVSVNVHDYVEHRTKTLIDFSKKIAKRVLESGEKYEMNPMSNTERKIIHKTITAIEGVDSFSEGNDPNRYVVVVPSND